MPLAHQSPKICPHAPPPRAPPASPRCRRSRRMRRSKVGLLTVKTGPLAAGGMHAEEGITTFLKEKNFTLSGRKIELLVADTGGNPAGAKNKAQELVERDKVNVVLRAVRRLRAARDARLSRAGQDADAGLRRRRGRHPAQGQPLSHAHLLHLGAVPLPARPTTSPRR